MASEDVEALIRKYKRRLGAEDHEKILHSLKCLGKIDMTIDLLTGSGIGKAVNALRHDPEVGDRARALVGKWKDLVAQHQTAQESDPEEETPDRSPSPPPPKKPKIEARPIKLEPKEPKVHIKQEPQSDDYPNSYSKTLKSRESQSKPVPNIKCELNADEGMSFMDVLSMPDSSPNKIVKKKAGKSIDKREIKKEPPSENSLRPCELEDYSPAPLEDIDWQKILPEINPSDYKPRTSSEIIVGQHVNGIRNVFNQVLPESTASKLDLNDPDSYKRKNDRTHLYAGRGSSGLKSVPTLFNVCIRVISENIDAIEDTGSIPFEILKPVLEKASAAQLFYIEQNNPYLIDDSDILWADHCKSISKSIRPKPNRTWRDLYQKEVAERDKRLKRLAAKVTATATSAKNEIRTAKLAVDVIPREVRRKQIKYGTRPTAVATASEMVAARRMIDQAPPGSKPKIKKTPIFRPASNVEQKHHIQTKAKPKMAPGMAKTLKLFSKTKTRRGF